MHVIIRDSNLCCGNQLSTHEKSNWGPTKPFLTSDQRVFDIKMSAGSGKPTIVWLNVILETAETMVDAA